MSCESAQLFGYYHLDPQNYVEEWPFGLVLEALGHDFIQGFGPLLYILWGSMQLLDQL